MSTATEAPPLARMNVPILWHSGYWDGPLSGVCLVEDRLCWFETPDDPGGPKRRFFIYELTDAEARELVTDHLLFEHFVGVHTCGHANLDGKRQVGVLHPQERWHGYYDRPRADRDRYSVGKEPIGKLVRSAPLPGPR